MQKHITDQRVEKSLLLVTNSPLTLDHHFVASSFTSHRDPHRR